MSSQKCSPDHWCLCCLGHGYTNELAGISNVTFSTYRCFPFLLGKGGKESINPSRNQSLKGHTSSSSWLLHISVRWWQILCQGKKPEVLWTSQPPASNPFVCLSAFVVSLSVVRDLPRHVGKGGGICNGSFTPGWSPGVGGGLCQSMCWDLWFLVLLSNNSPLLLSRWKSLSTRQVCRLCLSTHQRAHWQKRRRKRKDLLLKRRRTNLTPFTFHARIALCIPIHLTQVSEALYWHCGVTGGTW